MAMSYGNVYVASVAMGARDEHTLKAFLEADAYDGPSLIIAYSHCIAHGINMATGMQNQKAAVDTGKWLLYRYHPDRSKAGEPPLTLDSKPSKIGGLAAYLATENRFSMLAKSKPEEAKVIFELAQKDAQRAWNFTSNFARKTRGLKGRVRRQRYESRGVPYQPAAVRPGCAMTSYSALSQPDQSRHRNLRPCGRRARASIDGDVDALGGLGEETRRCNEDKRSLVLLG